MTSELVTQLLAKEAEVRRLTTQLQGCTIMAEGFKARVAELTAQLAEARESERAAVVAFIREQASNADARLGECTKELSAQHFAAASVTCSRLAIAIEAGEHLK